MSCNEFDSYISKIDRQVEKGSQPKQQKLQCSLSDQYSHTEIILYPLKKKFKIKILHKIILIVHIFHPYSRSELERSIFSSKLLYQLIVSLIIWKI